MSASPEPNSPEVACCVFKVEYGRPMLSRMLSISAGGITCRILDSTSSHSLAVSSMRVPLGARTCSSREPVSLEGKKFCPRNGISKVIVRHPSRKMGTNSFRNPTKRASWFW